MIAYFLGGFGAGIIIGIAFMWWTNIRHRRTPSLTKYVVFSLAMIILYTIVAIVYQWVKGQELSPTLTTCYYACFAGEILSSSLIKIFKLKEEKDETGYHTQSAGYYSSPHDIDSAGD